MNIEEALQLPYRKLVAEVLADCPKNCTWYVVSEWVSKKYTEKEITDIYSKLFGHYLSFSREQRDLQEENEEINFILDNLDIFWYAGNDDLLEKEANRIIKERESNML